MQARRPAMLHGGAIHCGIQGLTPEVLVNEAGGHVVRLSTSPDGVFRLSKRGTREYPSTECTLREYVSRLTSNAAPDQYLQQCSLHSLPGVSLAFTLHPDVPAERVRSCNLWVGPAGAVSPLHFDRSANLLVQTHGTKTIAILPPSATRHVRPFSALSAIGHMSQLIPEDLDGFVFNLRRLGVAGEVVQLRAGDALFIPAYWWHHVVSNDTSISVNIWWKPSLREVSVQGWIRSQVGLLLNQTRRRVHGRRRQ